MISREPWLKIHKAVHSVRSIVFFRCIVKITEYRRYWVLTLGVKTAAAHSWRHSFILQFDLSRTQLETSVHVQMQQGANESISTKHGSVEEAECPLWLENFPGKSQCGAASVYTLSCPLTHTSLSNIPYLLQHPHPTPQKRNMSQERWVPPLQSWQTINQC